MSRRKQANPAKLDSDGASVLDSTTTDEKLSSPKMGGNDSSASNTDREDGEDDEISANRLPSSDYEDDDDGDGENVSSPADASSQSPISDEECTQGITENTPYGCRYCQKAFPRSYKLARHEQTHTEQLQFTCSYCPRLFKHKRSRDRHTKLHTGDKKYKCQHCESAFSRSDHLKIHMKSHDNRKPFKCGTCSRGYNTAAALASHQLNHFKQEVRSGSLTSGGSTPSPNIFHCLHCPETFSKPEHLQNHLNLVEADSGIIKTKTERVKLHCMYCAKDFVTVEQLNAHVEASHHDITNGQVLNYPSKPESLNSPKQEIKTEGKSFSCEHCTKKFENWSSLNEHIRVVHLRPGSSFSDFTPYQSRPTDLSHKKRKDESLNLKGSKKQRNNESSSVGSPYDSQDRPCICSCCNAQMPNFKSFLAHMENHVTLNQSSANHFLGYCPICGEPGRDPIEFGNHIFAHAITSVPGRCCHPCKKSFDRMDDLQKHLAEMHIVSVYKCSICNEIFESKASIQLHFSSKHGNECSHFRCYLCSDQIFHDRLSAELHITMQHSQQMAGAQISGLSMPSTYQDVDLGAFQDYSHGFQCPFCQKNFKDEHLHYLHVLKEHSNCHEKVQGDALKQSPTFFSKKCTSPECVKVDQKLNETYSCDLCNGLDVGSEGELLAHKKLHHSKSKLSPVSLQCAYCNEYCKSRTDLENHMKSHQVSGGKGKYKCNICDEIYSSPLILADHKLRHCKILSGNTCTHCKTILANEQAFYAHHIEHSPGKSNAQIFLPVNCIICCQTLQTDVELRLHSKFHLRCLNKKEFLCRRCNQTFDNRTGQPSGRQTAENLPISVCKSCATANETAVFENNDTDATSPKQFTCVQCPQTFETEADVHGHAAMHALNECANLECRLCKQVFTSPSKLQVHLIEHNFYGMNQYSCYVCSSVFTAAGGLQNHIIGHGLNNRPYECSHCHMKFFFRTELDNHRFVHLSAFEGIANGKTQICKYCSGSYSESYLVYHLSKCHVRLNLTVEQVECEVEDENVVKEEVKEAEIQADGREKSNEQMCEIY